MVQHICTILTFQNVTKAVFWFTNYKSDIFHFASFSRCCSPRFVFMLSHSVVSPQGGDPNATSRCESFAPMRARARWGKTKASSVFTASCAIYVPKRQLDVKKKWGETSAVPIFQLGSPRKTDPTKCQVSFGKLRKKLFFRGTWWGPFSGANPFGKLALCWFPPLFSQHQAAFLGHRWRNSHSFAKIRLGMPT